jgi:hypothetical protein
MGRAAAPPITLPFPSRRPRSRRGARAPPRRPRSGSPCGASGASGSGLPSLSIRHPDILGRGSANGVSGILRTDCRRANGGRIALRMAEARERPSSRAFHRQGRPNLGPLRPAGIGVGSGCRNAADARCKRHPERPARWASYFSFRPPPKFHLQQYRPAARERRPGIAHDVWKNRLRCRNRVHDPFQSEIGVLEDAAGLADGVHDHGGGVAAHRAVRRAPSRCQST